MDVDVDSLSAIETLSRRTLRGTGDCGPQEDLGIQKFWSLLLELSSNQDLKRGEQNEVGGPHDASGAR